MHKRDWLIISMAVVLSLILGVWLYLKNDVKSNNTKLDDYVPASIYQMQGQGIEDFDLAFLKLEKANQNIVYSPLSIKYALKMLEDGANGKSKKQISNVLGNYVSKKYFNSKNISLANALFVKDSYKNDINESYIQNIKDKYNASLVYDSFNTPDKINKWVSDKTFNLINEPFASINDLDYILINALAIDMDWVKKIQDDEFYYGVSFPHESYTTFVDVLQEYSYHDLEFANLSNPVQSVELSATANKYDIINVLKEENIRKTVGEEYKKWLITEEEKENVTDSEVQEFLDKYLEELNVGYNQLFSSTDFSFYVDDDLKVFSKDLKTYDNTTLQYVGIMPMQTSLEEFIKTLDSQKLTNIIQNIKPLELASFEEGFVSEIHAYIPLFKLDYKLDFINDLKSLGITDVFSKDKADLSNLTKSSSVIIEAESQANLEFSNNGIKASALTYFGGAGDDTDGFEYLYDVPVKKIDLTFDKPFLFLIKDKKTNEVWFMGTVYEPNPYVEMTPDEYYDTLF